MSSTLRTPNTTYLITGANRGIGLALVKALLLRPSTTVIATIRSPTPTSSSLSSLPHAPTSALILLPIPDLSSPLPAIQSLTTHHGISSIDVLIANAGIASFVPVLETSAEALREHFEVNSIAPLMLLQACWPLLMQRKGERESEREKKFVVVSSSVGSIAALDEEAFPSAAYGASKAAVNYLVRKVHFECQGIVSLAVHPGWVQTRLGQASSESIGGVAGPRLTVEESASHLIEQIDNATRSKTSGKFISFDGSSIPW